jgi:uncharacterized Zn-binding protein involved in type VI secretion
MGDLVTGLCATHLFPSPALGVPQPGPPLPFSAPLTLGLCATVMIGGRPAAVMGSSGLCTPPHVGIHPLDPFFIPTTQIGTVVQGSPTVLFEGRPAARTGSVASMCAPNMGTVVGTSNVLVA